MEDLLETLSKEAINYKSSPVHNAAVDAQSKFVINQVFTLPLDSLQLSFSIIAALLECQQCNTRDPAHTLRARCFHAFKLAFETKRAKLVALSISGIYVRRAFLSIP